MKQLLVLSLMIATGHIVLGQHENDPSYSVHNYKHPNKAAYAKEHKLDNSIVITSSSRKSNDNYKQKFKEPLQTQKMGIKTKPTDKKKRSYKHPYGL